MTSSDSNHEYRSISALTREDVLKLLSRDDPRELQYVSISVAMFSDDLELAQDVCLRLAKHVDPLVRGNALLGFGHIARRFGTLNKDAIMPIVCAAQGASEEYVRYQANDALDDIEHYAR